MARKLCSYPGDRIAILVDGGNMYHTMTTLGWQIDFGKFKALLSGSLPTHRDRKLLRATYYTAYDPNHERFRSFMDYLELSGWVVDKKPVVTHVNNAGETVCKGDVDVEICVDAMLLSNRIDHLILFSGDGDFVRLVKALQEKGVRVEIISSQRANMISDDLRRTADAYTDIEALKRDVQRSN